MVKSHDVEVICRRLEDYLDKLETEEPLSPEWLNAEDRFLESLKDLPNRLKDYYLRKYNDSALKTSAMI